MRALKPLCVFILFTSLGCNESGSGKPAPGNPSPSNAAAAAVRKGPSGKMGKKTEAYWNKCIEVNKQFVTDYGDVWFKEFRPKAVGTTCRNAAKALRAIDNAGVDPVVIDHVNRVIRGFEQMAAIAETKGRESLLRDAMAAVAFVIKKATNAFPGAVANGGSLAMGIGASKQGGKATSEGQAQTLGIANKLMESEEQAIRHVRKTYGIELKPW